MLPSLLRALCALGALSAAGAAASASCGAANLSVGVDVDGPELCSVQPGVVADLAACCAASEAQAGACPAFVFIGASRECYLLVSFSGWHNSSDHTTFGAPSPAPSPAPPALYMWCSTAPYSSWPICNPLLSLDARSADVVSRMSIGDKVLALSTDTHALLSVGLPAYNWWSEAA
jgi:hypothetical protein